MFALIRMDWTLNRRILLQVSPLLVLWAGLAIAHGLQGLLMASFLAAAVAMLVPVFQNARESIEPFLLALPVSWAQIVVARYLGALMGLGLALLAYGAFGAAGHALGFAWAQELRLPDLAVGLGFQGLLLAIVLCLYLPFHVWFRGELASGIFAGTLACGLAPMLVVWGFAGTLARMMALLDRVTDGRTLARAGAAGLLPLALVSLAISLQATRRNGRGFGVSAALPALLVAATLGLLALALR